MKERASPARMFPYTPIGGGSPSLLTCKWSPLYAIINLIVSYYAERSTSNLVGKNGLTLHNLEGIFSINADMASLAGLAFGLVRGLGSTMTSLSQYMGGLTQSIGSQVAAEASSGNISVGNTSVDTHIAFNTSANHKGCIMGRKRMLALTKRGETSHIQKKIKLLPETDKRKPYPLAWEEQTSLFKELPSHLEKMALFAVNSGCPDTEICSLRWE
jgi:hypothetical protein